MNKYVRGLANPQKVITVIYRKMSSKFNKHQEERWAKKDAQSISASDEVLFVDLGANLGQGYQWFKRYFNSPNISFELFEPNPYCIKELQKMTEFQRGEITLHKCGVGVSSGTFDFYGLDSSEGGKYSQGGSIVKEHNSDWYEASSEKAIKVNVINFSEYLENKSKKYKKIIVKMDIEGAEVDLLEHLISLDTIRHISVLYVEFHSQYQNLSQSKITKERETRILKLLSQSTDVKVRIWH